MKNCSNAIQGLRFREMTLKEWKEELREADYISFLISEALEIGKPVCYAGIVISAEYRDAPNHYGVHEKALCISVQENKEMKNPEI